MRFKHIIAACESSFVTKAFKQYVETQATLMETIINGVQGAVTADTTEDLTLVKSQLGQSILDNHVWLFNEPVKVEDLLDYVYNRTQIAIQGFEDENGDIQYAPMDFELDGLINSNKTFSEGINDLKEQFAVASSVQHGCEAYLNTALTTVTDRLTYFKTKMTEKFSESAMNSVVFLQNMKSSLTKAINCQDYMRSVSDLLGIEKATEITSESGLDDFFEMNQNAGYEGTAPIFAVSLKIPVIGAVWNVVKTIGSSIWNFFDKAGTGIVNLTEKAKYATINPIDITCVNENGNNTFDQLFWRGQDTFSGDFHTLDLTQDEADYLWTWLRENFGAWMQVDTHFANVYFRIDAAYANDQSNPELLTIEYSYLVQPKTNIIRDTYSFGYLASEGPYGDEGDGVTSDLSSEIYSMVLQSEELGLPSDSNSEKSFVNNTYENLIIATQIAALTAADSGYLTAVTFPSYQPITNGIESVNNADAFYVATGEISEGANIDWSQNHSVISASNLLKLLIPAFLMAIVSQHSEGITYDNFFPYVKSDVELLAGKWGIKTDAQNQEAATRFYNNAITITAATIVAVYLGVKILKLVQNIRFKRIAYIQDINNRLAAGGSMTLAEQLKYSRYARKLGILNTIQSGLNTGSGFSGDYDNGSREVMNLVSILISGLK